MKHFNSFLLIPVLFAATTLSIVAAENVSPLPVIQKRSHSVPAQTTVNVRSDLGDVIIRTWDEDRVVVRSEAVHADVNVATTDANGCVNIDVTCESASTDFTEAVHVVYVPANATVRLREVSGHVSVEDVTGNLRVIDNRLAVDHAVVVEASAF